MLDLLRLTFHNMKENIFQEMGVKKT